MYYNTYTQNQYSMLLQALKDPNWWLGVIQIAIIIFIIVKLRKRKARRESEQRKKEVDYTAQRIAEELQTKQQEGTTTEEPPAINYNASYQPKYLLSINERDQYRKLKAWASNHDAIVFTKVRVLDLIEPRKDADNYKTLFYKIQAKHVDFVICDQSIKVKCIIELDDNSHKNKDREERDKFLDEALTGAGYKVLHTKYITADLLNQI